LRGDGGGKLAQKPGRPMFEFAEVKESIFARIKMLHHVDRQEHRCGQFSANRT